VTIRAFRIYLQYEDEAIARAMNRTHFGVAGWIGTRLKAVREQLRGPEAKSVSFVSLFLLERAREQDYSWRRRANSFEYQLVFELNSFIGADPIENFEHILPIASQLCAAAPWPQVRAIGSVLSQPLTSGDKVELRNALEEWIAYVDAAAASMGLRYN
jgi:hypothetical protein